jgi:DNA-binding beta-propeller fold protein YncE
MSYDLYKVTDLVTGASTNFQLDNNQYWGLAGAGDGMLFGTNPSRLQQVTRWDPSDGFTSSTALKPSQGTWSPWSLAVDPRNGNVIVTDNSPSNPCLVAFTRDGTFLKILISGVYRGEARGVAVDAAGNIYLTDYAAAGRLMKFDSSGRLLGVYGGALNYPVAVAVSSRPDGSVWIWVVVEQEGSVHKITCM